MLFSPNEANKAVDIYFFNQNYPSISQSRIQQIFDEQLTVIVYHIKVISVQNILKILSRLIIDKSITHLHKTT
jgi:hypothetical protein